MMKLFKHKHRIDYSKSKTKLAASLITGGSVQVSYQTFCKCGYQMEKKLSPAGEQQLQWGADYDSLFDDGPIRVAKGSELMVEKMRENWLNPIKIIPSSELGDFISLSLSVNITFTEVEGQIIGKIEDEREF